MPKAPRPHTIAEPSAPPRGPAQDRNGDRVDPTADTVVHEATTQLPPAWEPAGVDGKHRHDGGRAELHPYGDRFHRHDPAGTITFDPDESTDQNGQADPPPPPTDPTDQEPPQVSPPEGGWFAGRGDAPAEAEQPPAEASTGNGGRELERPGQVAAAFGTSTGDVPFQAALMSVVRPASDPDEAMVLAEEMAHLSGLMATAGRVAAEWHARGHLAEPGLLVALRFQVNAMLTGRGLPT